MDYGRTIQIVNGMLQARRLLDVGELSRLLGISPRTIWRLTALAEAGHVALTEGHVQRILALAKADRISHLTPSRPRGPLHRGHRERLPSV